MIDNKFLSCPLRRLVKDHIKGDLTFLGKFSFHGSKNIERAVYAPG